MSSSEQEEEEPAMTDQTTADTPKLPEGVEKIVVIRQGSGMPVVSVYLSSADAERIADDAWRSRVF